MYMPLRNYKDIRDSHQEWGYRALAVLVGTVVGLYAGFYINSLDLSKDDSSNEDPLAGQKHPAVREMERGMQSVYDRE